MNSHEPQFLINIWISASEEALDGKTQVICRQIPDTMSWDDEYELF